MTQSGKPATKTPIKDALPRELPAAVTQAPMKAIAPTPMPPAMEDAVDPKLFNDHYHPGRR
jgi:hypothetical protein